MNRSINVLIVDDQRLMRDGLRTLLELEDDLTIVGEAENGQDALERVVQLSPDVVLMDVRMPVMDGVEATRRLQTTAPNVKVIILTTFDEDEFVFEGLRAGAVGYLLKAVSSDELAQAIRTVNAGNGLIDPSITRKVVAEFARLAPNTPNRNQELIEPLAEREVEILRLIAQGFSNREIANQIFLAEGTVKNYVTSLLGKIGVRDRTQAALRGRELGLL